MTTAKLAIVIPCYNERETILEIVARVRRLPVDKSIIVVDNASTDGTRELLLSSHDLRRAALPVDLARSNLAVPGQEFLRHRDLAVLLQPMNLRKGTSFRVGLALADAEYVVCQDADLEYQPSDILRLLEHAERTRAVAVFGSRMHDAACGLDAFGIGRRALSCLFRLLYSSPIRDVATCYKLLRTDVARELRMTCSSFDLDFEIAAKLRRHQHEIAEVPIRYQPRDRAQGKKIRWTDGASAAWTLLKYGVVQRAAARAG